LATVNLVLVSLAAATLWVLSGASLGSLGATITNSADKAGTASTLLTATDVASASVDCTSATAPIEAREAFGCTRSVLPGTVASSGTVAQSVSLSTSGTVAPTAATLTAISCGPVELANAAAGSDPMLVRGGVTYDQAGPLTGGGSLGLDGSSALGADVIGVDSATLLGSSFTEGIWFKTAPGYSAGGALLGFGSQPSSLGTEANADRIVSMTTAGKLNFLLDGSLGVTSDTTTPLAYNNGAWHLVVVTVSTVVFTAVTVYVDGSQVATSTGLTLASGYTGYWHAGWSPVSSGSAYLAGYLSDAFVVDGTSLSSAQVSALAGAGTQATWAGDLSTDGASDSWPLDDSGTSTFAGPYPVIGATSPCTMVSVADGASSFCAFSPNSLTTACATPTGSSPSLAAWASAGALAFPPTSLSTPTTLTLTVVRGSTYNAGYLPGLHLYVPVSLTEKLAAAPTWGATLTWTSSSEQVIV
jgi:hypothetical protein